MKRGAVQHASILFAEIFLLVRMRMVMMTMTMMMTMEKLIVYERRGGKIMVPPLPSRSSFAPLFAHSLFFLLLLGFRVPMTRIHALLEEEGEGEIKIHRPVGSSQPKSAQVPGCPEKIAKLLAKCFCE